MMHILYLLKEVYHTVSGTRRVASEVVTSQRFQNRRLLKETNGAQVMSQKVEEVTRLLTVRLNSFRILRDLPGPGVCPSSSYTQRRIEQN